MQCIRFPPHSFSVKSQATAIFSFPKSCQGKEEAGRPVAFCLLAMALSLDLITNIVFGVIMVVIGITSILIVRWQTFFLLRNHSKSSLSSRSTTRNGLTLHLPDLVHDEERASHVNGPVSRGDRDSVAAQADNSVTSDTPHTILYECGATKTVPRSDSDLTIVSTSVSDTAASIIKQTENA